MAISSKDVEEMRRMLECPICLERQKTPRLLPCVHTFCEGCIQTFMDKQGKNGEFSCPTCKRVINIPKDGAAGFPFNHFLYHLNDCVPKTGNVFCFVCQYKGSTAEAGSMCIQCAHHLCDKCADVHCQTGLTLTHKVVSLDEVAAGVHFETMRRCQKTYCLKHTDKLLEIYCENCKIPVCMLCTRLDHDQHKMKNLDEAAKEAVEVLQGLIEPWVDAVDHAQIVADARRNVREDLTQEMLAQKLEELCKIYDDFKDRLEIMKGEAITKLNEQFQLAQKQTQAAYEAAEQSRQSLISIFRYAKQLIESSHPSETIQQFTTMADTLTSLDVSQLQQGIEKPVFRFTPSELLLADSYVDVGFTVESQETTTQFSQLPSESPVQSVTPSPTDKDSSGSVGSFTSLSEGEREFGCCGLAFCDGGFVVTDEENNKVRVFNERDFKLKLELQQTHHKLKNPLDVTCNNDGDIFITDLGINGVVRYDARGEVVKICRDVYKDAGYVTCHDNRLVVCDTGGGRVIIADYDCNIHNQLDGPTLGLTEFTPRYVCMDNYGQLVVSEFYPGRVHVIDHTRPAVVSTLTQQLSDVPRGVCVDPQGNILVADGLKNQVILYNNARAHVIVPPGDVQDPTGLCLPAPGQVSVVEYFTGVVKTFQYSGTDPGF